MGDGDGPSSEAPSPRPEEAGPPQLTRPEPQPGDQFEVTARQEGPEGALEDLAQGVDQAAAGAGGGEPPQGPPEAVAASPDDERRLELERLAGNIGELADDRENLGQQAPQAGTEALREVPPQPAHTAEAVPAQPATEAQEPNPIEEEMAAARETQQERRDQLEELREYDEEELTDSIEDKKIESQTYRQASVDPRIKPQERDRYRALAAAARAELRDMRKVYKDRFGEKTAGAKDNTQELAEAQREAKEATEYATSLTKMTTEGRDAERLSLVSSKEAVEETLSGSLTEAQREAYNRQLRGIGAKLKAIDRVTAEKAPGEEQSKREAEAKEASQKAQELQGKVGPVKEIKGIVDALQNEFDSIKEQIRENAEELGETADDAVRERLKRELEGHEKRLVEVGDRLVSERQALEEARKREHEEFNPNLRMSADTLREMSNPDFIKLCAENPAQAANYLKEVIASMGSGTLGEVNRIALAIQTGQSLSIRERAIYADWMAKDIAANGRRNISIEQIAQMQQQYPEMISYVFDEVAKGNDAIRQYREINPSRFEKMLRFVRNNPHWLLILLAIIAAGGAAAAVAAGPAVGVLAGGGGAAGAGGAGYSIAGRR